MLSGTTPQPTVGHPPSPTSVSEPPARMSTRESPPSNIRPSHLSVMMAQSVPGSLPQASHVKKMPIPSPAAAAAALSRSDFHPQSATRPSPPHATPECAPSTSQPPATAPQEPHAPSPRPLVTLGTPSLTAIVSAYEKDGGADRELLLALLAAKRCEDERLSAQDALKVEELKAMNLHWAYLLALAYPPPYQPYTMGPHDRAAATAELPTPPAGSGPSSPPQRVQTRNRSASSNSPLTPSDPPEGRAAAQSTPAKRPREEDHEPAHRRKTRMKVARPAPFAAPKGVGFPVGAGPEGTGASSYHAPAGALRETVPDASEYGFTGPPGSRLGLVDCTAQRATKKGSLGVLLDAVNHERRLSAGSPDMPLTARAGEQP